MERCARCGNEIYWSEANNRWQHYSVMTTDHDSMLALPKDVYYIKVWQRQYDELVSLGSLTPVTSATKEADEHMRRVSLLNKVPWDTPDPE